ncbi:hypothetical protein [Ktedonobacter racemifer]|uniref:Uncharacterized protein n=1 Tax=Ktedonobacter racemifer DSM 44963 TaxID=485913 RepID=D6U5A1_KTERA|nr:hypothetical protein [Ktedonobacter racemifer]EFH81681.1 hypothetical protein Krac_2418 [Ktedonobacter racemifer DSM 44963]
MRQSWLWPICLVLAALVAGLITFALPGTTLQPFVVFSFLFFCPGMAIVRFFRLNYIVAELTLAVAISLSLGAIIAGLFMYSGHWSPSGIMGTLLLLCLGCSIIQLAMLHPAFSDRLKFIDLQNTIRMPTLNLTEAKTMQLPRLTRMAPQQKDIVDRDTIFMAAIKDTSPHQTQLNQKAIEEQEDTRAIEEKATAHVPSISIAYSPVPQAKPITHKQPLGEQETQQLNISALQAEDIIEEQETSLISSITQKDSIEEQDIALSSDSSPSSTDEEQTIEEQETSLITSPTLEDIIEEQDIAPIPGISSPSADEEQAIEEKETVNIPSVQAPEPDLIPEQTLEDIIEEQDIAPVPGISSSSSDEEQAIEEKETVNVTSIQVPESDLTPADTLASKKEQMEQEEKEPAIIAEPPADSSTSEKKQEDQEEKESVITTAKPEPSKESQKKEKTLSTRTIIPHTNPHKAIVQDPAAKNVLRKKRLTKEVVKQEVSEQDNI